MQHLIPIQNVQGWPQAGSPPAWKMKLHDGATMREGRNSNAGNPSEGNPVSKSLDYVRNHEMFKTASLEVFGSNIPLTLSASTLSEMIDQGVFQFAETFNAFGLTLAGNYGLRRTVDGFTKGWGKAAGGTLTQDQELWRRFALSMPVYAWLVGFEFFTPLLRNMITLHNTQEIDFTKITDVNENGEKMSPQEAERYRARRAAHIKTPGHQKLVHERMDEYKNKVKLDVALTLPTMAGLFGLGLMGMKHGWKMPRWNVNIPKGFDKLLGEEKTGENIVKKAIRQGGQKFIGNLFEKDFKRGEDNAFSMMNEILLPDGDWSKVTPLMCTVVWMLPTYAALGLYSRDELEKPEIAVRAAAGIISTLIIPNAVESLVQKLVSKESYPIIQSSENAALLARTAIGTLFYTGLPVLGIRLTRQWRAEQIEKRKEEGKPIPQPDHVEPVSATEAYAKIVAG